MNISDVYLVIVLVYLIFFFLWEEKKFYLLLMLYLIILQNKLRDFSKIQTNILTHLCIDYMDRVVSMCRMYEGKGNWMIKMTTDLQIMATI